MLNPSTADANKDDPTIRRIYDFSRSATKINVVNLAARRATNPDDLIGMAATPGLRGGHLWAKHIEEAAAEADIIYLAWGKPPPSRFINMNREEVLQMLKPYRKKCHVLGFTKDGHPRHPLYVKKITSPIRADEYVWRWALNPDEGYYVSGA